MAAKPASERPSLIYADIGVSPASDDRRRAAQLLPGLPHVQWPRLRISQGETWRRYAGSRFVLSLQGNGLDAHRTWEALYLGAIVITLRSTLDPLYEGLPVVLVDGLEDVADRTNLPRWSEQYLPLTNREWVWDRLSAAKWMENVRRALVAPL